MNTRDRMFAFTCLCAAGAIYVSSANAADSIKLSVSGGVINGSGTIAETAPGEVLDVSANAPLGNNVFEKWRAVPATANLGALFNPRASKTSLVMPSVNVALTAAYVAAPGWLTMTLNESDSGPLDVYWSVDSVTWAPAWDGDRYALKPGTYTVKFKSLDVHWLAPAQQKVVIKSGEDSEVSAEAASVPVVSWQLSNDSDAHSGTVALSPANGQVLPGKSVKLTATPSVNYVFAGWTTNDDSLASGTERNPSITVAPSSDAAYSARFRLKSLCTQPVVQLDEETSCAVGAAYRAVVSVNDSALPVKFSATSLPPGLKLDATTGVLSGVPSRAGAFNVTFKATGAAGVGQSPVCTFTVAAMPVWASGTYNGVAWYDIADWQDESGGPVTMSITAQGKISGKFVFRGTNFVFSAPSYDTFEAVDGDVYSYSARVEAKAGNTTFPIEFDVMRLFVNDDTPNGFGEVITFHTGHNKMYFPWMYRNIWGDADTKDIADRFDGYYTATVHGDDADWGSGYLALTVDKNGVVKTAGQLADGTALSLSSPLILDGCGVVRTFAFAAPAAYKGGHFMCAFEFRRLDESDANSPIYFVSQTPLDWKNFDPRATDSYGSGFDRRYQLSLTGGWYNKTANLREYYENGLTIGGISELPELQVSVSHTDWNATQTQRIVSQETDRAEAMNDGPAGIVLSGSPFEGTYSGTYSGDDSGSWRFTVDRAGRVTQLTVDGSRVVNYRWSLDEDGNLTLFAYGVGYYANVEGTLERDGTCHGGWQDTSWGEWGTFVGKRTSVAAWLVAPKADTPTFDSDSEAYDYAVDTNADGQSNTSGLTFSFTQATGLFKGTFKFWFDYISSEDYTKDTHTLAHTSKTVTYQGILTPVKEEEDGVAGRGYFLWADKSEYDSGKTDTFGDTIWTPYSFNRSFDFMLLEN